ncbi:MAG: hypothetical protein JO257_32460 [Deltaproteobacteria bacterium]|nr:hypothetical protein [Deltaproteobacteria bacterium]
MKSLVILAALASTANAEPAEFIADAKELYTVAACGGGGVPPEIEKIVDHHCKAINERLVKFRALYFDKGKTFFDKLVPADAPTTIVYPFGGGDLLSALVAFPNATEITTISLEQAGDPRRLATLKPAQVEASLGMLRLEIGGLISVGSNTSENLSDQQRNDIPGQVASFMLALVAGGYEPVSMRYFTIDDAGDLHYLEQSEIDELDKQAGKSLKGDWKPPTFSPAFANVEIQYRKVGETQLRVHRHIGWNLGNDYLKKHPQLIRHLEKKGSVTVLVKGASYLLWRGDFSRMREYILDHLKWMLSDSTGIPPKYAKPAGMIQETYGDYNGAFLEGAQANPHDEDMIALWKGQRRRALPFRFGYVDKDKQAHLLVTRPR